MLVFPLDADASLDALARLNEGLPLGYLARVVGEDPRNVGTDVEHSVRHHLVTVRRGEREKRTSLGWGDQSICMSTRPSNVPFHGRLPSREVNHARSIYNNEEEEEECCTIFQTHPDDPAITSSCVRRGCLKLHKEKLSFLCAELRLHVISRETERAGCCTPNPPGASQP